MAGPPLQPATLTQPKTVLYLTRPLSGGLILGILDVNGGSTVTEFRHSGTGISPSDLPHIFERFYRADTSRSSESGGSGLDLSIAKRITEAHRGNSTAASRIGEGYILRVHIPFGPAPLLTGCHV